MQQQHYLSAPPFLARGSASNCGNQRHPVIAHLSYLTATPTQLFTCFEFTSIFWLWRLLITKYFQNFSKEFCAKCKPKRSFFCMNNEFPTIFNLTTVDYKGVVIPNVSLHVLDTLSELCVVVVPTYRAGSQGDDPTSESCTLTLQSECWLRLDDKSWCSTLSVNEHLLHSVLFHLNQL